MFTNPTVLTLYAESRMLDALTPRRVSPVAPRLSFSLPRLFATWRVVSNHKHTNAGIPRIA